MACEHREKKKKKAPFWCKMLAGLRTSQVHMVLYKQSCLGVCQNLTTAVAQGIHCASS